MFTNLKKCNYELLQRWQHLHPLSINVTISIVRILFLKHFKLFNSLKSGDNFPQSLGPKSSGRGSACHVTTLK